VRERWKGKGEREGGSLYNWKPPPPDEILATPLFIHKGSIDVSVPECLTQQTNCMNGALLLIFTFSP